MRGLGILFCLILLQTAAQAQTLLDETAVAAYLHEENPFVYGAVAPQYVSRSRVETAQGGFDTRLGAKYDNKRYPTSDGEFADVYLEKPTESGVELLVGYRRAEGVQEYNNIKTGDDGEVRVGVKVPVFSVANAMNERRYRLSAASLDAVKSEYVVQNNLRHLYFDVFAAYYRVLYRRALLTLETDLLEKARRRVDFIRTRVEAGDQPEIALLEARRQVLNREQRHVQARNGFDTALGDLLKYLGLERDAFAERYDLPSLPEIDAVRETSESLLQLALQSRPDLKTLQYDRQRFTLDSDYNTLAKYPKLDVALYGVHDFEYDNGFKIAVDMDFPIEQRRYSGRKRELFTQMRAVDETLAQKRLEIRTALENRLATLQTLAGSVEIAGAEVELAQDLESAETKKYRLGAGDLMSVNLRELDTLQARQKKLEYLWQYRLIRLEIDRETGQIAGRFADASN